MEGKEVNFDKRHFITVLFQGDSITEACRDFTIYDSLGTGYAMMVANRFSFEHEEKRVRFLNRGIAGDKIKDLKGRWKKDSLNLKPDIVSILIGINDTVGKYFWKNPTSTKKFERDYRILLEQTRYILDAKIVLLTPFIAYTSKLQRIYAKDLNKKIDVVRKLSKEFKTLLIPLDEIFEEVARKEDHRCWSADGIHPTAKGHSLIANSWYELMRKDLV